MPSGIKGSNRKYNCLFCNKENLWGSSKINKFCDNKCQGEWKWISETIPRIEAGNCAGPDALKKYLKEKFGDKCSECGQLPIWHGKELVLQLDHRDGNSDNNFPSNIRLLCPQCHSQTENFGCKGYGNTKKKSAKRNTLMQKYRNREVA